ncbi:MAG: 4Fe-4S binding protein [Acaryochloridaceae cyanobacterium RL_2_7]|nr:4Fe-4S binding protein [Acaryochloridaceae cyanobacterium RL_2_7]
MVGFSFFNATRPLLAGLFLVTMGAAIAVGYLFAGKSWCQYFCPMAPVQQIYMQPMAILSSGAHRTSVGPTQSMCRISSEMEVDQGACVGCKKSCMDIDGEGAYWATINKPQSSFLHYAYLGLVCGYFAYYYLYAGNWNYYLSGVWAQDSHQLESIFQAGFYLRGYRIEIPKVVAAPLTLGLFTLLGVGIGQLVEKNIINGCF